MIIQEIHFLHERSRRLSWFIAIQNFGVAAFFIATQYLVAAYGWRWWYGLFAIVNGLIFILSALFLAESAFDRTGMVGERKTVKTHSVTGQRWSDGLKVIAVKPRLDKIPTFYIHLLQGLAMPTVMWALLLNGIYLGLYVFGAATFAPVLIAEYRFSFTNLAFVQAAQIIVCLLFLPLLGYGGDYLIKVLARRNNSFYKPEYRLFPLAVAGVAGVICAILYGQAAKGGWHWWDVAITYNGGYFAFLGANIVGLTYTVDSFPTRAGPLLVLLCAGRGFISFGLSYSTLPAVKTLGYHGTSLVYGVLCGVFALAGIAVYILGPRLRVWSGKVLRINVESEDSLDQDQCSGYY